MPHIKLRAWPVVLGLIVTLAGAEPALADHVTPGEAGQTKVDLYDNTNNGWNVTTADPVTGGPDPVIGFVNFRPTVPGDPDHVVIVVATKDAAPNCTLTVQLQTSRSTPTGGLPPDGDHSGFNNVIGELTTNRQGSGNSGAIVVDVTTLNGTAQLGPFTYAHVDLEDSLSAPCTEADGTSLGPNEYGASGFNPAVGPPVPGLPANIHWLQP
jgi:hypothetical protein